MVKAKNSGYLKKDGKNKLADTLQYHPMPDDAGNPVRIWHPSEPTGPETWADPGAVAVFVPLGAVPDELYGIPFKEWTDHPEGKDWSKVDGVMENLDEPPMPLKSNKGMATGVVVEEQDGRIWLVSPTNAFGGYKTTYPKGRVDKDAAVTFQANAIKEVFEETGLKVVITGYVGDFERTTTVTRMYRGRRVGGSPAAVGWETQAVQLVPKAKLAEVATNSKDMPLHELVKKL